MNSKVEKSFYTTVDHPFQIDRVEDVFCNLCGSRQFKLLATELSFEIRKCVDCGLVYVSPQPVREELAQFYENMYTEEAANAGSVGYVESHLRRIVMNRKPEGGRLLEVGCGQGNFLQRISDLPWDLTALELSVTAAARAREQVPRAEIVPVAIEDASFVSGRFDCIVMIAVLEHVKDPHDILRRISDWLAPGGVLLVQVPYIASYIRLKRWLPGLPIHFEAPRHLFDFSPETLGRYLAEAGLTDIRAEIARPYASPSRTGLAMIWGIKAVGLALYGLSGGRYIYPYAAAITVHAVKATSAN